MKTVFSAAVLVALSGVACAPAAVSPFAPDAYHEAQFPVRASYADPGARQILSGDWVLLNSSVVPAPVAAAPEIVAPLPSASAMASSPVPASGAAPEGSPSVPADTPH